jgi:RHH-type proline utilization regulon transcriptional repressor/proline dehydrogenase/delta 1-pyrroline-5-carboxylate dehydrogenase
MLTVGETSLPRSDDPPSHAPRWSFVAPGGTLIRAAVAEGGKTIAEADPEVSEAIDFAEFYGANAEWYAKLPEASSTPLGVVVVVPPWNFPIAIPCGGSCRCARGGKHR